MKCTNKINKELAKNDDAFVNRRQDQTHRKSPDE